MQRYDFKLCAPYGMLPFFDEDAFDESEELQCSTADVTEEDCHTCIKAIPFCAVLHTARQSYSPVAIEFHENEPVLDLALWDHVTECALDLPSGRLFIEAGWSPDKESVHLQVIPGHYRMRACHAKLASIGFLPSEGDDHYLVLFWPSEKQDTVVLKQYEYVPPA